MYEFQCPACGCTEVRYADKLGGRVHACCRDCGMEYSFEADAPEDDCDDDGRFATDAEADEDAVSGEDWDGQPDEMQEWHDFDPDC